MVRSEVPVTVAGLNCYYVKPGDSLTFRFFHQDLDYLVSHCRFDDGGDVGLEVSENRLVVTRLRLRTQPSNSGSKILDSGDIYDAGEERSMATDVLLAETKDIGAGARPGVAIGNARDEGLKTMLLFGVRVPIPYKLRLNPKPIKTTYNSDGFRFTMLFQIDVVDQWGRPVIDFGVDEKPESILSGSCAVPLEDMVRLKGKVETPTGHPFFTDWYGIAMGYPTMTMKVLQNSYTLSYGSKDNIRFQRYIVKEACGYDLPDQSVVPNSADGWVRFNPAVLDCQTSEVPTTSIIELGAQN